jgi:DNA-binding transcriptional regulator YdaS (Cro superfamily)
MLNFQTRLLKRAAQIAGDTPALAASLGVTEEALRIWMEGKAKMPDSIFLATADLVLEDDIARAAHDRRVEPRTFGAVTSGRPPRADADA